MNYKQINNLTGWGVFLVALIVYLLTVAPTASFWDCGEFIACSNELEVTHPPGAPLFMLLGRIFAMFAFNDVTLVAFMINLLSVFSSAFTALFTCWTVTMLAKRGLEYSDMDDQMKTIAIMLAGVVAGLSCTFADSIWFNAVEAEVYAMSSFFTALAVWLMFKWVERADQPGNLKWLILIAYVMGLSTGVHLLNLLTIPALALVYYFKKYEFSWGGFIATMLIAGAALASIQYGLLQYTFSTAWVFEKFFTGTVQNAQGANPTGLGLPIGTGFTVFAILIIGAVVGLIIYSIRTKNVLLNTAVLCYTVVIIGLSSYSLIFIRSNVDPAIDMNNPENILTYLSYMRREQYGDRPLLKGPMYNARPVDIERKGMKYVLIDGVDRYVEDVEERAYVYDKEVWFPRMYQPDRYNRQPHGYINYVKRKGSDPKNPQDDRPTRAEDFRFFLNYQVNHMYIRYFMWNFVGRNSDIQDRGWESGLEFNAPPSNNKANNHYFFLPLFLGILGLVWQYVNNKRDATVIGFLFLFTGLAIIVYLNQWPSQPRERDYSYAGSFQTFCMWIGLGVLFLFDLMRGSLKKATPYVVGALSLLPPILMGSQNWDDHTRKGRNIDIEFAYNLLNSCEEDAILFTGGDNDTFPLWYIQEVEGVRTDVRVVNLELLISDWYIDQMKQSKNGAKPVPISMKKRDYVGEKGLMIENYPSRTIRIPIDKEALVANGTISEEEAAIAGNEMIWNFKARGSSQRPYILRKDSVMIDIIRNVAADNWERPVYFATLMPSSSFVNLQDYFRMEGVAHRVVPVKKTENTSNDLYYGRIGQDIMLKNLTENFKYTNLDNPDVYFDEHIRNVIVGSSYRNAFFRLSNSYLDDIDRIKAQNSALREQIVKSSTKAATDSLHEVIAANEKIIEEKKANVEKAMTFMDTTIPHEAVPKNLSLLITHAQLYERAKLDEQADVAYEIVGEATLRQLRENHMLKRRHNPQGIAFRAALITVQYLARKKKFDEATEMAQEIANLTGSQMGLNVIEQLKGQN